MRLATWNVNSLGARLPRVLEWLATTRPDIVCMQETKLPDDRFPRDELAALGYEAATYGMNQWNGVAVISSVGLADVRRGFGGEPGFPDVEARALAATCGGLRVWSLYVPNGRTSCTSSRG
jgi:exodeoxyribonuclease-3